MGFYGNITNTSNTTFSFDRIYPNRLAMDANANNDGIFIGRYVLVEYDNKATISNIFVDTQHPVKTVDGEKYYYAYTTNNFTDINTRIQYKPNNRGENKNINVYFLGEFGQVQKVESNQLQQEYYTEFYQCVDSIISENDSTIFYALFKYVTKSTKSDSEYIKNFAIDEAQYKEKKGYDSTVWTKASIKKENGLLVTEYVRIADLNSVVPTFDLETDAPTMKPLVPHFDADSTNVYYKLHTQPQWGLRVAEVESEKVSDSKTNWISSTYDPETGQLIPSKDNGEHDAAIYFNRAAFLPQVDINRKTTDGIEKKKEDGKENNYFTINPTGTSGNQYYLHTALDQNGNLQKVYGPAVDIQEMRINLPAIGNMMSDAWDIIYGPKRDKARTDEDGSLQGRLDSFKAIEDNHIPIKRNDDGTIIGTAINGNNNYQMPKGKNILTTTHFPLTTNDPWINVTIDNSSLQGGYDKDNKIEISQENNNAIRIRHSANSVDSTTTSWDKNDAENYTNNSYNYYEIDTNINGNQDEIKLYTPYVDATGHVVGKNIETVTLPYGFKTITTNGRATETSINTNTTPTTTDVVADNTQDTLSINSGNKWVRIDTNAADDSLTIRHDVHPTSSTSNTTDWTKTEANTTIPVSVYTFDNAGHYESHHTESYKLPFGYGKIIGDSGSTAATATYDSLAITADDAWIETNVSKDTVNITHTGPVTGIPVTVANVEPEFGETFSIIDWQYDSKGHKYGSTTHTVKMPDGSYTPANTATTHTDIITSLGFTPRTGAITSTKANTDTLTLYNYSANSGSLDIKATDTINTGLEKIQNHINGLRMSSTSTTDFITEITQTDGKVAVKRAKAGTLVLGTQSTDKTVSADDSLNSAINKLEARIKTEEENRKAAIDTLYGGNAESIADAFDTIKEIADFLEQDENGSQSGIEKIISDISANANAIETEKLRATQAETALSNDITEEETRAKAAENTLTTNLNNEISRAKGAENTLTTNLSNEVTRATNAENTLNTRITNLVGNIAVSTQIDNKISAFDSTLGTAAKVDIEAYETRIATLEATVLSLEQRLTVLEEANTSPPVTE